MSNIISTLSISELLEKKFYVPAYQRGYRWADQQMEDLLNDIYYFAIKPNKSDKEFYCLQPIIVQKTMRNGKESYDIIDGQQRLTSIRILFSYLIKEKLFGQSLSKRYGKDLYQIDYETRPACADFLDNINVSDDSDIDRFHIGKAYQKIEDWVSEKVKEGEMFEDVLDSILRTLVFNQKKKKQEGVIQVIWYEIKDPDTNPIDVFIRINLGKISLTNAELIKALFLQERNFGEGDIAKLRQLEIAQDWDRIENELQDENFWWFLNKEQNKASSHIEFIFDMMCAKALSKDKDSDTPLNEVVGGDHYQTFRFFNHLIGDSPDQTTIKELWDDVIFLFQTFKEWYNNPEWYHYIGFLISCGKSVQDIINCLNQPSIRVKSDATKELISSIKEEFKSIEWTNTLGQNELHLNLSYESDKGLLRKFFLLFNLEYIIEQSKHQNLIYKFPFKAFKFHKSKGQLMSWDIEHISSAIDNPLEKFEDKKTWLENALQDVPDLNGELKADIKAFSESKNSDGFENLYLNVQEYTREDKIDEVLKNSIGNLTLLDAGTNRGYGNALFASKRRIIIEKDKRGVFIPLCTKNVFLKYFDGNTQSKWIEADIIGYRNILEETMSKFIQNKPLENEKE